MTAPTIFISYRRQDTLSIAGKVCTQMRQRFGLDAVFLDDGILPGADFPREIVDALTTARVCLALIGAEWLSARDEHFRRRIDDETDWVRRELEHVLGSPSATVIPVLVGGAALPPESALPPSLASLASRQASQAEPSGELDEALLERIGALLESNPNCEAKLPPNVRGVIRATPDGIEIRDVIIEGVDVNIGTRTSNRSVTPSRNSLCACGSGKKYKRCHGAGLST